jgi:hypothetical protein
MVIVYLFTSLLGALATIACCRPNGLMVALLSAPLGGSILTLMVAGLYVLRTARATCSATQPGKPSGLSPGRTRELTSGRFPT